MEPQIRFCTSADGTRIGYALNGSPDDPPMIPVRGWGYVLEAYWAHPWGWHFEEVEGRHRRVVDYDRRGCGASQRDASDLSLAAHVADLSAVADALSLERFDLMGWHDGCAIAASYAAQNVDRVGRLVLCSPFADAAGTAWGDAVAQTARMIRADWSLARRAIATVFFPSGPVEMQRWWSRVMKDSTSPEAAARHYEEFIAGLDITAELPRIQAPTLVLHFSDVRNEDRGEQALKGVGEAVRVWAVVQDGSA
jgi:pimeloyl-ACP methyl ester carboxylesterase